MNTWGTSMRGRPPPSFRAGRRKEEKSNAKWEQNRDTKYWGRPNFVEAKGKQRAHKCHEAHMNKVRLTQAYTCRRNHKMNSGEC